jgi:hypothetical protein
MRKEGPEYQQSRIEVNQVLMILNFQRSKQHRTHQADSSVFSEYTNFKKNWWWGQSKNVCVTYEAK